MATPNFDPEIWLLIFENIDELRDLRSVMLTCKDFKQIINTYPKAIIKAVLTNAIGPAALQYALGLFHLTANPVYTPNPARQRFDFPIEDADLLAMARTHSKVSRFTFAFYDKSICMMDHIYRKFVDIYAPPLPISWPALTAKEKHRIHRAFYRFEIYCRIKANYDGFPPDLYVHLAEYGFQPFASQNWEIAELSCCYDFYHGIAQAHIRKLNADFANAVLTAPGALYTPFSQVSPAGMVRMEKLHELDLPLFALNDEFIRSEWATDIAMRGLDLMTDIAAANSTASRTALNRGMAVLVARDWPDETDELCESDPAYTDTLYKIQITPEEEGIDPQEDGELCGTFGFRESSSHFLVLNGIFFEPLRAIGIPFWDAQRVRSPMFRAVADETQSDHTLSHFWQMKEREWGDIAAVMLQNVSVPRDQLEMIKREFTGRGLPASAGNSNP